MPRRPWIVWAYLATSVTAVAYGIAFDVARGHVSPFGTMWDLALTSIAVLIIWNASRGGWIAFTALGFLFIPFLLAFLERGAWGKGVFVIQCVSLGILVSPWMFRWIWRDGRPMAKDEVEA